MNIFYPRPGWLGRGPGVKSVEASRVHIGWNEEDVQMWGDFPYCGKDRELSYNGGAVIVIHEHPEEIRIFIIKSHTGSGNRRVGEVRVVDGEHATEVIVDNPVPAYRPRTLLDRLRSM